MKSITNKPKSVISLLLCAALIANSTAPAFAQARPTRITTPAPSVPFPVARQDTFAPNSSIQWKNQQVRVQQTVEKLAQGKLTQAQLARLKQIEKMFTPSHLSAAPKSDFDRFNDLYTTQINREFTREAGALQDSNNALSIHIDSTAKGYRKGAYVSLAHQTTSRVLTEQGNTDKNTIHNLSEEVLSLLGTLSYDASEDLSAQIDKLADESQDPVCAQILHQIAQETTKDPKYALHEQAVNEWKNLAIAKQKEWYLQGTQQLKQWRKNAASKAQQVFDEEYNPQLLKAREEEVKKAVADLWALKETAAKARATFLQLAPSILPLRTLDNHSFFTQKQKDWLTAQYTKILQDGLNCAPKEDPQNACKQEMIALTGIGMASNSRQAADAVEAFMSANLKTSQAVPALLGGTAALLAMKQYQLLRGVLHSATRKEHDIESLDILSFETLVNLAANINGQYLGEVSKYAQYPLQKNPTDQTPLANAWEDVAQLLAADGSAGALALLREYGVEQCHLVTETSVTLQEKSSLVCAGIIPFLAGALASGKSGANQYNPAGLNTTPGYVATQHGNVYISPKQAQQNAARQTAKNRSFHAYAERMGLSNEAMLARHLFVQSMGDLNAESELRLDTQLYKVYQTWAKKHTPKPGFEISSYTRNSAAYNAKRARQDRTQIFRKIARWGDVAVLLWCVVDISKWAHSGFKIARAMGKAAHMARNGATVAERAMMLRRLNITPQLRKFTNMPAALSTRIKNGMAPSVLAELPHFTSQSVELPKIEGFIESAGKLVAQNMRFSAETGLLAADVPALTEAAHGAYSAQQINGFNNLLTTVSRQANAQFANRSAWQRWLTLDKNAAYRSTLARQLAQATPAAGLETADLHNLAMQVVHSPITVPENIQAFKLPSLWKNQQGIYVLNQATLVSAITNAFGIDFEPILVKKTETLLNNALLQTQAQFSSRSWIAHQWSALRNNNNKIYKNMLLDNLAAAFDKDGLIFTDPKYYNLYRNLIEMVKADKEMAAPAWLANRAAAANAAATDDKFHTMGSVLLAQKDAAPVELPLLVEMQVKRPWRGGIRGISADGGYQRVIISENKKGALSFGFGNDLSAPVTPSQFKLTLEADDMPALIRAAQGYTGAPLEIKLTAPSGNFFGKRWTAMRQAYQDGHWNPLGTLMRGKNNIYVHNVPVSVRLADGSLQALPLTFKADSYLGLRNASAVLEEGGKLAWYQDGKLLSGLPAISYGLPKNQIRPFLGLVQNANLQNPLRVRAVSGKDKIQPLMWATGLSLSSASTGLIAPLENVYADKITEQDKVWISLALPYAPSLAAPLFSPLVMKIGALRTLQLALGVSTVGLGFAAYTGFSGKLDKENLPPIWPLFVSGTAIGVSSALSRSGLNLLIDSMGGGGTLLKSMAYKNIGSFALLVPPFVANFVDKDIDFSFAFPVLGTLSAGALTWVSASRISTAIGKQAGFMPFEPLKLTQPQHWLPTLGKNTWTALAATGKEAWSTTRLLGTKEVLPLVLAATAFTGFEAGAFNKAGNQMIRPVVKEGEMPGWIPETNRNNYTSMLTNLSVISFPLLARLTAKPVLRWMSNGRAGDEYRHMLHASFALNATGAGLLYANGFDGFASPGFLGIALMGLGTANMTQSFQKLSNISVKGSSYARMLTKGLSASAKETMEKSLVTKTMTGFPVQQLGIAIVPTMVSTYTDRQIDEGTIKKSEAPHSSLWIPVSSLALCFALSAPQLGLLPTRLPNGIVGLTKGLVGSYPGAVQQLQQPQFYLKEPLYGFPQGFTPILNNPIVNTSQIIPSQKALEKIEDDLERKAQAPKPTALETTEEEPAEPISSPLTKTL